MLLLFHRNISSSFTLTETYWFDVVMTFAKCIQVYEITHFHPFGVFFQLAEALDKTFASLNQPSDYKELKGKDPSSVELLHKIEQVAPKIQGKQKDLFDSWLKNQTNLFRKIKVKVDFNKNKPQRWLSSNLLYTTYESPNSTAPLCKMKEPVHASVINS